MARALPPKIINIKLPLPLDITKLARNGQTCPIALVILELMIHDSSIHVSVKRSSLTLFKSAIMQAQKTVL